MAATACPGKTSSRFSTGDGTDAGGQGHPAYTPGFGGAAEGILKMALGNGLGFRFADGLSLETLFGYRYGSFVLELDEPEGTLLGETTAEPEFRFGEETVSLAELTKRYEDKLEPVYSCNIDQVQADLPTLSAPETERVRPRVVSARPKAVIPVFPGTNCEYDTARALRDAGAEPEILVINNRSAEGITRSVERFAAALRESQIVLVPGGFSGGDEPDGSGKFITAFFRNAEIREAVTELLERRDGLMAGICNGFQALIKLGLVPYGKIVDTDVHSPTLTYNTIGRHQSKIVRTRIASNRSPWLAHTKVGNVYSVAISHGEGRFLAEDAVLRTLAENGQIATQYVDFADRATADVQFNPNNSAWAIEGITSPDGRVFGKMGHSERVGTGLYKNVPGCYDMGMFESAVEYFKRG